VLATKLAAGCYQAQRLFIPATTSPAVAGRSTMISYAAIWQTRITLFRQINLFATTGNHYYSASKMDF
jgi:hypothetical protein